MSNKQRRMAILVGVLTGLWRRSLYTAAALATVLLLIVLFYALAPGKVFVQYDTAQAQPTFAGEAVPVHLCRTRLLGPITIQATRSFYRSDTFADGFKAAGQYTFSAPIENGSRCVDSAIKPEKFKLTAGYWRFHTDITFKINGWEKSTGYDSNTFQIFPRPTNAELQLQLEQKIQELQEQLDELGVVPSTGSSASSATSQPAAPTPSSETAQTKQETTSAPPDTTANPQITTNPQPTPAQPTPAQAGVIEKLLNGVLLTLQ